MFTAQRVWRRCVRGVEETAALVNPATPFFFQKFPLAQLFPSSIPSSRQDDSTYEPLWLRAPPLRVFFLFIVGLISVALITFSRNFVTILYNDKKGFRFRTKIHNPTPPSGDQEVDGWQTDCHISTLPLRLKFKKKNETRNHVSEAAVTATTTATTAKGSTCSSHRCQAPKRCRVLW